MPAPTVSTAPDRADLRSRLLSAQFWVGIGLAPIAVLLLIFGGTAAAAVLAIIAVVVLALSVMLRSDAASSSRGYGDTTDEMIALREDVRADITTAARATHRALSEKMSHLEESVAGVQRLAESFAGIRRLEDAIAGVQQQVEAARAVAIEARAAVDNQRELPLPPGRPATVVGSVPSVVRHTETVVTRSMYVDEPAGDFESSRASRSTVYGSAARSAAGRAAIDGVVNGSTTYGSARRAHDVSADDGRDDPSNYDASRRDGGRYDTGAHDGGRNDTGRGGARWIDVDAAMPRERESRGGSRRRDEPHEDPQRRDESRRGAERRDEPRAQRRDDQRADEQHWGETPGEPWQREPSSGHDDGDGRDDLNQSWTEQRLRAYLPQLRDSLDYRSGHTHDDVDSSSDLANDARWSQMRDGDRWAEVRSDDRGRELRMAERHAERHVDETGTQLRIVDRWSSVREERMPAATDRTPAHETRAQRRRRTEHDDRDDRDDRGEPYPVVTRAELPQQRHAPDDVRAERSSGEVGRGWRDVRSGVIEPDHSDRYEESRYQVPAKVRPSRDAPSSDSRSYDSPSYDDVGIYRSRSDDRAGARRDSGDFPPARGRDSGDFPPARSAEPTAYEESDDRWVREAGPRSNGQRPQLDFEVTDDRWH